MKPAEEYILRQAEPYKSILLYLQTVIERVVPEVELRFKYSIPFYYLEGRPFCYLNQSKDYVDLGFWNAAHLNLHLDKMETAGRKIMRSLRYRTLKEVDQQVLDEVLKDAWSVRDRGFWN